MIFGSPMSSNGDPVISAREIQLVIQCHQTAGILSWSNPMVSKIPATLKENYSDGGQPQLEQPYGLKNSCHSDRELQCQLLVQCPQMAGSLSWSNPMVSNLPATLKENYNDNW